MTATEKAFFYRSYLALRGFSASGRESRKSDLGISTYLKSRSSSPRNQFLSNLAKLSSGWAG